MSQSSKTILGDLPPSSSVTFFKLLFAAASAILRPTRVLPVKAIFWIPMCSEMAAPTVLPYPTKRLNTPGGKPACTLSLHMKSAVRGVNSEHFMTIVLPVASAGPIFQHNMRTALYFKDHLFRVRF